MGARTRMDEWIAFLQAALLGVIEGLTEFLPVSSTGHLIIAERLIGAETPEPFKVMIQLGAVLAVMIVYIRKILDVTLGLPTKPEARRFALAVLVAFIPAMILGALFSDIIKGVLFSPFTVSIALVVGGVAILAAERWRPAPVVMEVDDLPVLTALKIGLCQCLALMPGVSRSGATIVGAMLLKIDRKAAAEFSFFLSMPTMMAAFAYDAFKNRETLLAQGGQELAIVATGFVFAFLAGLIVVRLFLGIVGRMGFAPFAWYRIVVGLAMLALFWPR
jgi:undecaprenyl-diphosphatase